MSATSKKEDLAGQGKTGGGKTGRPPKLSEGQVADLRKLALDNPGLSMADLTERFCREVPVLITPATARTYLLASGLERVRPSKSIPNSKAAEQGESGGDSRSSRGARQRYGYTKAHRDEGDDERYPSGLTDPEWELVGDLFEYEGPGRPPKYLRRNMVDACCYVVRTGCQWRMVPKDFPPWQDVYAHFRRWTAQGLFESMHDRLRDMWREREHRATTPTAAVLDSQSIKTSAQGGPKGYDAGKKVNGRKRHVVTDMLGLVLAILVTAANVQDRDAAYPALAAAKAKYPTLERSYVDAGYTGRRQMAEIKRDLKIDVEIVRHPGNRNVGRWRDPQLPLVDVSRTFTVLPKRWVVERTHAWLERSRRLEKDQDRRLDVSTAWAWLAESRLLLRRLTTETTAA